MLLGVLLSAAARGLSAQSPGAGVVITIGEKSTASQHICRRSACGYMAVVGGQQPMEDYTPWSAQMWGLRHLGCKVSWELGSCTVMKPGVQSAVHTNNHAFIDGHEGELGVYPSINFNTGTGCEGPRHQ